MDINNQLYIVNVKTKPTKTLHKEHKKYRKKKNGQHLHTLALKSEPLLTYFDIQISK
jgi:hypothetical protein